MKELVRMKDNESFLINAEIVHGDVYEYLEPYIRGKDKIWMRCNECEYEFQQTPSSHIYTVSGCSNCANIRRGNMFRHDTPTYISKLTRREDRGEYYGYDNVNYTGMLDNIEIYCPECDNYFLQSAKQHLYKNSGCHKCVMRRVCDNNKDTTIEYINKLAQRIDKGEYYGYDMVEYMGTYDLITIYCPKCDDYFYQTPNHHLHNNGICNNCSPIMSIEASVVLTFIEKYNISYILEQTYDACRGKKRPLPFDFYLQYYNILIEYDGRQHFEPIYGEESFLVTQCNDSIKNQWCLDNDIPLIRIKYDVKDIEGYLKTELEKIGVTL